MYDDLMTFAADGTYTYDPVDGMTFMNNGVTKMNDKKVDNPTVPGAAQQGKYPDRRPGRAGSGYPWFGVRNGGYPSADGSA